MSNRIIHEFNATLHESEHISDFYSKRYMLDYSSGLLEIPYDQCFICDSIDMYYRLAGYELFGSTEENSRRLSAVASDVLGSLGTAGVPFSFSIYNHNQRLSVYFGTSHKYAIQMKTAVKNNLQNASFVNEWITTTELSTIQKYNGMIIGVSDADVGDIDTLLNGLVTDNFIYSCVFFPIEYNDICKDIRAINSFQDKLQRVTKRELTLGSNRQRRFDSDNHDVLERVSILSKEYKRLSSGLANGLWYVAVFISSDNQESYHRAASMFNSHFRRRASSEDTSLLSNNYGVNFTPISKNGWIIPTSFLGRMDYGGLYGNSLLNICDLSFAASLSLVPLFSHRGYSVKHFGESATTSGAFDQFPSLTNDTEKRFCLGITENGQQYTIPLDSLRQHAFITGSTQFGKSTSIRKILSEAATQGIPFVVVESAKKEYWELKKTPEMSGLLVLSAGSDARPLRINPFQPEVNTMLDAHIQSLIQAFLSLFDQTDPLPQVLTELIYMCYEKRGWDVSRRVSSVNDLEYPILSDLLLNLDECIESIGYGAEIQNNMKGVIRVRISSLIRQAGKSLNTRDNTSISLMFDNSSVIELDDYSDRNKPFVASLIAIKANEFSKQGSPNGKLHRLLVLEEAHHIIPNPEQKSITGSSALSSKYFSNMLSEISAYGTGVVIVDQRPSSVSGNAIANTGFKLVHNLHEETDMEVASASLALRPHEKSILPKLRIGEALVTLPQTNEVSRIHVDGSLKKSADFNLGSLFCNSSVESHHDQIQQYDLNYLQAKSFSASAILSTIQSIQDRTLLPLSLNEKVYLAGDLLRYSAFNELIQRQRIYDIVETLNRQG